jgi:hypothetical protein
MIREVHPGFLFWIFFYPRKIRFLKNTQIYKTVLFFNYGVSFLFLCLLCLLLIVSDTNTQICDHLKQCGSTGIAARPRHNWGRMWNKQCSRTRRKTCWQLLCNDVCHLYCLRHSFSLVFRNLDILARIWMWIQILGSVPLGVDPGVDPESGSVSKSSVTTATNEKDSTFHSDAEIGQIFQTIQ